MRTLRIGVSFRGVRYLSIPRMSTTAQGADEEVSSHGPQVVPSKAEIIAGASREPRERLALELGADEGEILDRLRRRSRPRATVAQNSTTSPACAIARCSPTRTCAPFSAPASGHRGAPRRRPSPRTRRYRRTPLLRGHWPQRSPPPYLVSHERFVHDDDSEATRFEGANEMRRARRTPRPRPTPPPTHG